MEPDQDVHVTIHRANGKKEEVTCYAASMLKMKWNIIATKVFCITFCAICCRFLVIKTKSPDSESGAFFLVNYFVELTRVTFLCHGHCKIQHFLASMQHIKFLMQFS